MKSGKSEREKLQELVCGPKYQCDRFRNLESCVDCRFDIIIDDILKHFVLKENVRVDEFLIAEIVSEQSLVTNSSIKIAAAIAADPSVIKFGGGK